MMFVAEGKTQPEIDPQAWGYVAVPNYFLDYWQPLLGVRATALYLLLRRFAYGQREECWPSLSRLAASLGMERRALSGRTRRCAGVVHDEIGLLQRLEQAGLLQVTVSGQGHGRRYRCRVRKRIPLLSPAQLAGLPLSLQAAHRRLLARQRPQRERPWPAAGSGDAQMNKHNDVLPMEKKEERQDDGQMETADLKGEAAAEAIWREARQILQARLPAGCRVLAGNMRLLSLQGGVARIGTRAFGRELFRRRGYQPLLREALEQASGRALTLEWVTENQYDADNKQHG